MYSDPEEKEKISKKLQEKKTILNNVKTQLKKVETQSVEESNKFGQNCYKKMFTNGE